MKYYKVDISTSKAGVEFISGLMEEMGISGAVISDPDDVQEILENKEMYKWDYADEDTLKAGSTIPKITVYFEKSVDGNELMHNFREKLVLLQKRVINGEFGSEAWIGPLQIESIIVNDEDWKDTWKEHFKPARITEHIAVKPVWEDFEAPDGVKVIEIDPGMAFGTGTHATTRGCITLLEKYLGSAEENRDISVLDVGCGSGILGIAAYTLGCGDVLGIEIDEDAVRSAEENVKRNCPDGKVRITEGDLTKGVDFKADIVLANMTVNLIELLTADVDRHLNEGGVYICSGILVEQKRQAEEILRNSGFKVLEFLEDGEWLSLAAGR